MGIFLGGVERRATGRVFAEPPIPAFPGADVWGSQSVQSRPDQALAVPTVWRCVGLLAGAVSMLPLQTYKGTRAGAVPARLPDGPFVTEPSAGMTQSEWLHMLMVSALLRGNTLGRIVARGADLRPTEIDLIHPDTVTISVDDNGRVQYRTKIDDRLLPRETVWHLRGMTLPGAKAGLSPIAYAAATIGVDLSSREFAGGFFAGGGIPKAVVTTEQQVSEDQARTIKDRMMAKFKGREPIVLGAGLTYQQISVKPEESQFLATQQANVTQIARFFNVPAGMVDGPTGNSMTYSNVEQQNLHFLTFSLAFWLKRIEDAISQLLPYGQFVRFDVTQLLRTDAETAAKVHVQYLAGKVFCPSEIREQMGYPPMTAAQKTEADLVPLTITPLGNAKATPQLKVPPGAEAPVPADDVQGVAA